jgi:DNA (cytosine-5)-methyltransferase 1
MRAISLFSGIGGLDYGFGLAGIQTVIQVENDPHCQLILERHWPEVARVSDIREVDAPAWAARSGNLYELFPRADAEQLRQPHGRGQRAGGDDHRAALAAGGDMDAAVAAALDEGRIDLIYGGFPCQDVSVAGKRAGLSGKRSSLWFDFERVLRDVRPRWCVIENVPGLLSSHRGRDFGLILRGLAQLGYGWAYRVLDARFFGVPQRRRRIVIVGCLGDQARAGAVLALCQSCGGHTPAGGSAGQGVAFTLAGGSEDSSRRIGNAWNTTYLPAEDVAYALPAAARGTGDGHGNAWNSNYVASTLSAGGHPDSNVPGRHREDDENLVAFGGNNTSGEIDVAAARSSRGNRYDFETDTFVVAHPLRASDGHHGWSGGRGDGDDNLIADPISTREQKTWTHEGSHNFRTHNLVGGVRRLTPLECERLQGFPDGWTDGPADSHRYRMLGNAVATVVAQWVGHRLLWANENP